VNNSVNIDIAKIAAKQASSLTGHKSLKSSDISSFSDDVTTALRQSNNSLGTTAAQKTNDNTATKKSNPVAEKIAALLKEENLLPESMENISLDDLTKQIAAMLLQQNVSISDFKNISLEDLTLVVNNVINTLNKTGDSDILNITPSIIANLTEDLDNKAAQGAASSTDNLISDTLLNLTDTKDSAKTLNVAETKDLSASETSEILSQMKDGAAKDKLISDILLKLSSQSETLDENLLVNSGSLSEEELLKLIQNQLAGLELNANESGLDLSKAYLLSSIKSQVAAAAAGNKQSTEAAALALAKQLKLGTTEDKATSIEDINKLLAKTLTTETTIENIITSSDTLSDAADITSKYSAPILAQQRDLAAKNNANTNNTQQQDITDITSKVSGISIKTEIVTSIAGNNSDFNSFDTMSGESRMLTGNYNFMNQTNSTSNNNSFANYLTATGAASYTSPTTQMIALQIQQNVDSKVSNMKLQLTPAELGKMEINLEFKDDGSIKAHLTVEKPETLAILKKDSYQLEKILQQAGFDTNGDTLSFDLKQQGQQNMQSYNNNNRNTSENFEALMDGEELNNDLLKTQIAIEAMGYITSNRVNITV